MTCQVYLNDLGIVGALGCNKTSVRRNMLAGNAPGMGKFVAPLTGKTFHVGQVPETLPALPPALVPLASRNNQMILMAVQQIETAVAAALSRYPAARIGVVMGTSTSGVAETELGIAELRRTGSFPPGFHYRQQEIGVSAEFIARYFQLKGPVYGISTACSSSGKVFASARGLIAADFCDAVIVGGADSLCELTLNGFKALDALADERCNPFSLNRKGINVGEAAAVFLMSRDAQGVELAGVGEASEAYHMSAPDPSGAGALRAMQAALDDAGLQPSGIGYINLHGTGTRLNDEMESHAVYSLFGNAVPASSTKALTGHTLGAAGATEAALLWLLLNAGDANVVIPHLYDGSDDPALSKILLSRDTRAPGPVTYAMSNSFAFGGSNVSVILGRKRDD